MSFSVLIPARYTSERFPGKPLIDLNGKTMIRRVYERATNSHASGVFVATDDDRIVKEVESFGGQVILTSPDHDTGTDRLHEAVSILGLSDDHVVVNVQGDEPLIPETAINQVAAAIPENQVEMSTLKEPITDPAVLFDPNVVKVVTDSADVALYFSRAPIPWSRDTFSENFSENGVPEVLPEGGPWFRHLGLYAYTVSMLKKFVTWPVATLESTERLEQLRALIHGTKIHVGLCTEPIPPGIDVPEDVSRTLIYLQNESGR